MDFDATSCFSNFSDRRLQTRFQAWRTAHENNRGDHNVVVGLGWSKGLSHEFSRATGKAQLDFIDGDVTVTVRGLEDPEICDVWLVDNLPGAGRSVQPEEGDTLLRVGTLEPAGSVAKCRAELGIQLMAMEVDLVVITRSGKDPTESGVLFGSPSLFQRFYTEIRRRGGATRVDSAQAVPSLDPLIRKGGELFFNETFSGNGRTCGTCHPAENNFTIDPVFIATLPAHNPLFVAERVPGLAENFEKPKLMRQVGVILENLEGFDDLENKFVLRAVPHTLALRTSILPAPNEADGTTIPPSERLGWSGDGSPGSGTLREFAIGAVRQHFTKSLGRAPGVDFRFPTDEELDAMEAFMLFIGREEDPDLRSLFPSGAIPARGKEIFLTADTENGTVAAGKCNLCHLNAGASVSFVEGGANFNFDTGVEELPDQPLDLIDAASHPPDGGFGTNPQPDRPGAFGNGSFNTPPLVESADTGPFFHNHAVETIEEAVGFYSSSTFNNSPAGQFLASRDSAGIGIQLESTQIVAVAAFLRVLNAVENIRGATEFASFAHDSPNYRSISSLLRLAAAETEDAV
ncbi:MAG: hypothetical protein V3T77_03920, partial [Planctomycetota bacterium]